MYSLPIINSLRVPVIIIILWCYFAIPFFVLHVNFNLLESTILQGKRQTLTEDMVKNKLQIIHCLERHHWITANTVNNAPGEVTIMDLNLLTRKQS